MEDSSSGGILGGPLRPLLAFACTIIIVFGLHYAADILNPVFLSMFVVMAGSPMIRWLGKKRVPNWLILIIMLLLVIGLGLLFVGILAVSLQQFQDKLPEYSDKLGTTFTNIQNWLTDLGIDTGGLAKSAFSASTITKVGTGVVSALYGAFSNILLMFLITIFMISEVFHFPTKIQNRYGADSAFRISAGTFGHDTRTYLFMRAWLGAITAGVVTIIFYAFGVDFPLLWGMIFFLMGFVPNVGFIIAIIPPFAVAFIEQGVIRAAIMIAVVIVVNSVVDNFISPKIMGKGLALTPLAVFLSLVFWAWVFGPIGAIISVPLTIMVKRFFLENFESTRFLADAMSPLEAGPKPEPPPKETPPEAPAEL